MSETPQAPAGWYPDPTTGVHRYWDGQQWSEIPMPPPVAPVASADRNTLSIIAFVMAGIALLFVPPLFGIAGIVLSSIGISKGERLAKLALGLSVAGLILGLVIGYLTVRAVYC